LWKSDGTATGTVRVKDIEPGAGASYPDELAVLGDTLFFRAGDRGHGDELWVLDGRLGLMLHKAVAPAVPMVPGTPVTYTLTFTNDGHTVATGVLITDVVAVTLTNTSYTYTGVTVAHVPGITYTWAVRDLTFGAGGVITVSGVLGSVSAGVFTNTANIAGIRPDLDLDDNMSKVGVTVENVAPVAENVTVSIDEEDVYAGGVITVSDANGDPLSYVIATPPVFGAAHVDAGTGAWVYTATNRTMDYTDGFTVTVGDGHGGSDAAQVTVHVTADDDAPTISNILNQRTDMGAPVGPIPFTIGDVDTPVGALVLDDASSNPALAPTANIAFGGSGAARTVTVTPTAGMTGTATITITVDDGASSAYDAFVLAVGVNSPPEFTSSPVETAVVGVLYTYAVTAADADPGDVLTITAPVSATWLALTQLTTRTAVLTGTPVVAGEVPVELHVTDGEDGDTQPFTVTVEPEPNRPPVADAGSDQVVVANAAVTLDGSLSADPDGDLPLVYGWSQTGGAPAVVWSSSTAISRPTFTAPGVPTILTFTLVVTDSKGLPDPTPDAVVITVTENYYIYLPLVLRDA